MWVVSHLAVLLIRLVLGENTYVWCVQYTAAYPNGVRLGLKRLRLIVWGHMLSMP